MMDVFKHREILGLGWICHAASSIGGLGWVLQHELRHSCLQKEIISIPFGCPIISCSQQGDTTNSSKHFKVLPCHAYGSWCNCSC
jgi:hypothetical protein